MICRRLNLRNLLRTTRWVISGMFFVLFFGSLFVSAQVLAVSNSESQTSLNETKQSFNSDSFPLAPVSYSDSLPSIGDEATETARGASDSTLDFEPALPMAPMAAPMPGRMTGANPQREGVPWAADWHQPPFSRVGIGADLSPLGIGIKAATPLDDYFDLRVLASFFNFNANRVEVDGFNIYGNVHLASLGTTVDIYPWNSMWRLSGGLMLFNGNQASANTKVAGGTSFNLAGQTYYSSNSDPVTGTAVLALNTVKPEPMVSFGFGRFVPHSNRHWSFPSEFGILYMGAPAITVTPSGTVCTDKAQLVCSDVGDTSTPVAAAFNSSLQAKLANWRKDLNKVQVYPIFSYSVMYSFNIR